MISQSPSISSRRRTKWTLEEALDLLRSNPHDPCIQYIALQLSRRIGKLEETTQLIMRLAPELAIRARNDQNLQSLISGAAAVHESLQLDEMNPVDSPVLSEGDDSVVRTVRLNPDLRPPRRTVEGPQVPVSALTGPGAPSHPWREMLGESRPAVSKLARLVPHDFYFVESKSLQAILEAFAVAGDWGKVFRQQGLRDASTAKTIETIKSQLLLDGEQFKTACHAQFEEVAIIGSDLYVAEGGDVSVLFLGPEDRVNALYNGIASGAAAIGLESRKFRIDRYDGVKVVTDDSAVRIFAVNLTPNLHVRSNSLAALERIVASIDKRAAVVCLGDTDEFAYVRSLMPWRQEEDVFIYLSDALIHRLVGAQVRLAERRRMVCYNRLRMLGHAILLYCSENGECPQTLEQLFAEQCTPHLFNQGGLVCPDGGQYSLLAHGDMPVGQCSRHGTAGFLTPCIEIPIETATAQEVSEYMTFVQQYNQHWQTYFDPIAMRLQLCDGRYRLETMVLPLIDNSIYTALANCLGSAPQILEKSPLARKSIFSAGVSLNKEALLSHPLLSHALSSRRSEQADPHWEGSVEEATRFFISGLGSQMAFHVYDARPTFSLDISSLLAEATIRGAAMRSQFNSIVFYLAMLTASVNVPVYASLDVADPEIVDHFFSRLANRLSVPRESKNFFVTDFSKLELGQGRHAYFHALVIGPARFRLFWARIRNTVYISSQLAVIEDLWKIAEDPSLDTRDETGSTANALVRFRPDRWQEVLPDFRLCWRENERQSCRRNLAPLTVLAKALAALNGGDEDAVLAGDLFSEVLSHSYLGAIRACPGDGVYSFDLTQRMVKCSCHGDLHTPVQVDTASADNEGKRILPQEMKRVTAALNFMKEGLRAEPVMERVRD